MPSYMISVLRICKCYYVGDLVANGLLLIIKQLLARWLPNNGAEKLVTQVELPRQM